MTDLNFNFAELQQKLQPDALTEKKDFKDDRFWKLSRGDDDTGTAVIRLVVDKNRVPFVKIFHHSCSDRQNKRYYIEPSPQTIGLPCPISERWSELFNVGTEEAKAKAKILSRKIKFITNIKVINDPANPSNNGKYFLWEFGTKLLDKFLAAMNPGQDDLKLGIKPNELYNPMEGSNVMLKIKKASGFFNYDDTQILPSSSEWDSMESAVNEMDEGTKALQEFLEPGYYKSYDDLKSKLVYFETGVKSNAQNTPKQESAPKTQETTINTGIPETQATPPKQEAPKQEAPKQETTTTVASDDDGLDFLDEL
jgi:hypothetical protein